MTFEKCSEYILPKVLDWIRARSEDTDCDYFIMPDNASVHKAYVVREYPEAHIIKPYS